jgi:uncharacterized cofD-like protein
MSIKRIVVIGGGTGTFTVLQALRDTPCALTAIVATADNGGSTGVLRDELGVLPPGDLRQALVALAPDGTHLRELLSYRFTDGGLAGHNAGNILLSALEKVTGSSDAAVTELGRILAIRGRVLPVTKELVQLNAQELDGNIVRGQHNIDEFMWSNRGHLQRFWLEPATASLHPEAKQAISQADLVVIAPGSYFTSLIPNLLVRGMAEALQKTRARVVTISNLMTEKGQAELFSVQDYVELLEQYAGSKVIDYVLYNTKLPPAALLERYRQERERQPVRVDVKKRRGLSYRLLGANLLATKVAHSGVAGDPLAKERTLIRHDPAKLARALLALLYVADVEHYLR